MATSGKKTGGFLDSLKGYKTYATGGLSILGAGIGWWNGSLDPAQALQLVQVAIMGMFIRSGVKSTADNTAN